MRLGEKDWGTESAGRDVEDTGWPLATPVETPVGRVITTVGEKLRRHLIPESNRWMDGYSATLSVAPNFFRFQRDLNKEKKFSNHTAFRCYHCCESGTHGSRVIAETAYLFLLPPGATKCSRNVNCS